MTALLRLLVGCSLVLLFAPTPFLSAQVVDFSRREMATPGIVVETGFRTGSCDFLRFTPDGEFLYAGGDDKVVRTWRFDGNGLQTIEEDAPPNLPRAVLRWPSLRERRGAIYASSLSPDGKLLAIGGWGLRPSQLAVIDRFTGDIRHSIPNLNAPRGWVWSMDFDSTGRKVALGLQDGSVWVWDLDSKQVRRLGRHDSTKDEDDFVFFVQFRNLDTIVSADYHGQVLEWSTRGGEPRELFRFSDQGKPVRIIQYAASADRRWLAAAVNGKELVVVRSLPDGKAGKTIRTPAQHFPRAVAFDARGEKLAVSVHEVDPKADFQRELSFRVRIYDLKDRRVLEGPRADYRIESLAFHPKGQHLAFSGGDDFEIGVWDLKGERLVHSQTGRNPGRSIWGVGISADGRYLAYQHERQRPVAHPNRRGSGPWRYFDLGKRLFLSGNPPERLVYGNDELGGWKVLTRYGAIASADRWFVQGPGLDRPLEIPWNWKEDNFPECWTFVPSKGSTTPRLVVGHLWGASLFEIASGKVRRLRWMHGHDGSVTSLAVTPDGKRLVTGSRDQTVCGWSLEDWPYQAQLGAQFFDKNGLIYVGKVETGSPAWELGLSSGDEIQLLAVRGKPVFNRSAKYAKLGKLGSAETALASLLNPDGGVELYFGWRRPGDSTPLMEGLTTVKDRPIWRFFPTRDREWVLWRWQDYYYDTSTKGDSYIGWVGNTFDDRKGYDVGQAPKFYRAEQFRELFQKPDKVAQAIADWGRSGIDRTSFRLIEPPGVRVALDRKTAAAGNVVRDETFSLALEAAPNSIAENQQLAKVVLWINDYRHMVWTGEELNRHLVGRDVAGKTLKVFRLPDLAIPRSLLRSGSNIVLVQAFNNADVRGESKTLEVTNPLPRKNANLYGLLVGVGDYTKSNPRQPDLVSHEDALALAGFWKDYRGKLYGNAEFKVLTDRQVTPEALLGHLDQLAGKVRPDDLLVFHLGGHGLNLDMFLEDIRKAVGPKSGIKLADYQRVRQQAAGMGKFVFVCAHFDLWNNLRGTSISLDDLYGKLARLPCHKVIFLDACHAGAVDPTDDPRGATDLVRALTREGVGPVIFSACKPKQVALEIRGAFFKGDLVGGLFAQAVLDTLVFSFDQADTNRNGKLEPTELDARLRFRIPSWLEQMRKSTDPAIRKQAKDLYQDPVAYLPQRERNLAIVERKGKED